MMIISARATFVLWVALTLASFVAGAQQPAQTSRIGWLAGAPGARALPTPEFLEALRQGLREKGWVEGRNLVVEARWGHRANARQLAAELIRSKVDVVIAQGPMVFGAHPRIPGRADHDQARAIADFAERRRIPATSGWAEFAVAGNLMSYAPNLHESWRGVAGFVDKILRGAKPADLPVQQPTRFELAINLNAAKAPGVTIPPALLARADRVIQ